MKLIVGLGNPGGEYESTRHNVGFMVIDKLAKELSISHLTFGSDPKHTSLVVKVGDVMLIKPQTYMNKSGEAVKCLLDYYKLKPGDLWVIHDDIDLPLGKIRIRAQGAAGGHNGVESIIESVGTDKFVRFRLGTGRGKELVGENTGKREKHRMVIEYVLSKFHFNEAGSFKHLIKNGVEAVRIGLTDGIDKAMNRFN
jgi:peptidyl-tRNA hydrolase, PTH1 family